MPVSFADLETAFLFVSSDGLGENQAFLHRPSGEIYLHSDIVDIEEELPDDIDSEDYIEIPDRKELDLGKPLVMEFVRLFLPDDYDEVSQSFRRKGAYGRFKNLLARRNALNRWYEFSARAEKAALKEWCASNAIELRD